MRSRNGLVNQLLAMFRKVNNMSYMVKLCVRNEEVKKQSMMII